MVLDFCWDSKVCALMAWVRMSALSASALSAARDRVCWNRNGLVWRRAGFWHICMSANPIGFCCMNGLSCPWDSDARDFAPWAGFLLLFFRSTEPDGSELSLVLLDLDLLEFCSVLIRDSRGTFPCRKSLYLAIPIAWLKKRWLLSFWYSNRTLLWHTLHLITRGS